MPSTSSSRPGSPSRSASARASVQERADVLVPAVPQVGARLGQQHGRPQPRHERARIRHRSGRGGDSRPRRRPAGIAGLLPEDEFHQVGGDEQVRIRQGLIGFHRWHALEPGMRAESASAKTALDRGVGDGELGRLGGIRAVGQAQWQQVAQTETGQVLPVHERVREPAAAPGALATRAPVADPRGPVDARSPGRRTPSNQAAARSCRPRHGLPHTPLQQVAEDLRE